VEQVSVNDGRKATAIRFDAALYEDLAAASKEHGLPINWLVNKAVEEFLGRLLPAEQWRVTNRVDRIEEGD
jgi:hypothetical protein